MQIGIKSRCREQFISDSVLVTIPMGSSYTLTDLVGEVFATASTVVNTIKSGVSAAWDGVKAGATFILTEMFRALMNGLVFTVNTALTGFLQVLQTLVPSVTLDLGGSLPKVNGAEFGLRFANDNLDFMFGRGIGLADLLGEPAIETLGMPPDDVLGLIMIALVIDFFNLLTIFTIAQFFQSQILTLEKAVVAMLSTKLLFALSEIVIMTAGLNSLQGRIRGLTAEFFGQFHFGWALGTILSWVGSFKHMRLVSLLELFTDVLKDNFYRYFYGLVVGEVVPEDSYWVLDYDANGLRIGLFFGYIEGTLMLEKMSSDDIELMASTISPFLPDILPFINQGRTSSISIRTGLWIMLGISMVAHLMLSTFWLYQTRNYL